MGSLPLSWREGRQRPAGLSPLLECRRLSPARQQQTKRPAAKQTPKQKTCSVGAYPHLSGCLEKNSGIFVCVNFSWVCAGVELRRGDASVGSFLGTQYAERHTSQSSDLRFSTNPRSRSFRHKSSMQIDKNVKKDCRH